MTHPMNSVLLPVCLWQPNCPCAEVRLPGTRVAEIRNPGPPTRRLTPSPLIPNCPIQPAHTAFSAHESASQSPIPYRNRKQSP